MIATARQAAVVGDDARADNALTAEMSAAAMTAPSVTLARRAAGVCGWLRSDNDYPRAERLARRTIAQLAVLSESNDADRVERLYWKAWLEGYALDHKVRALELLQAAGKLAPDDPRIIEDSLRWAQALAEFGR